MPLIPGLPDEISRECLISIPFNDFSTASAVCKAWKNEIALPEFLRRRKSAGRSQKLVIMAKARFDPNRKNGLLKCPKPPIFRLTAFEPATGNWCELPTIPGFSKGLPFYCGLVSVGSELVVMGGLDPVSWKSLNFVFIYNFATATWRRGADMPGSLRLFFACASDLDRTVYIAGGHDDTKNALRSAMRYEVARDEWLNLPDMVKERDECKGIFQRGKFHVIGGFCTERQGQFGRSKEAYDVAACKWERDEDYLCGDVFTHTCVGDGDKAVYACVGNQVVLKKDERWHVVANFPTDICHMAYVAKWKGNMMVIGTPLFDGRQVLYEMSVADYSWKRIHIPDYYLGHVQSSCFFQI